MNDVSSELCTGSTSRAKVTPFSWLSRAFVPTIRVGSRGDPLCADIDI